MSPGCLDILITHLGNALLTETELQPLVKKSQKSFSEFTTKGFKEYYSAFLSFLPQTENYFKVPGTTKRKYPPRQNGRQNRKHSTLFQRQRWFPSNSYSDSKLRTSCTREG